jgi:hypothetical protein
MKNSISHIFKQSLFSGKRASLTAFAAGLLTCGAILAEPAKTVELDFSKVQTGCLPDKASPDRAPATVETVSAYGRLRGTSGLLESDETVASAALGRTGQLNALRFGSAEKPLKGIGHHFENGKSFAVETWVSIYDADKYFNGAILNVIHGYKQGFRLEFTKQKWAPNGWLNLTWGIKTGSDKIACKPFPLGQWHQVVIGYDGKTISLYVDGELAGQKVAALNFSAKGGRLFVHNKWYSKAKVVDFKLGYLSIYEAPLSASEVKAHYTQGAPATSYTEEREAQLTNLKLRIPHDTYGYFQVGTPIPVLIDPASEANELRVNGKSHALPLKQPVALTFGEPGMQVIDLALLAKGTILKQASYPVAIVPYAMISAKLGARELGTRQAECTALGMRLNRVVVDWAELESKKQEYNWRRLDAVMDQNEALGTTAILCLTGLPRWVPLQEGSKNLPADLGLYRKIWQLLVNRYDDINFVEVWNSDSPHHKLKGSLPDKLRDYIVLLKTAAEVVREDAPDAKILAGRIDLGDGLNIAASLQKQASEYYDIFSAQHYSADPATRYGKSPWSARIRKATSKPVWNTACGVRQFARHTLLPAAPGKPKIKKTWPVPTVDEWTGANWQIQDLALQLADGIERVILETGPSEYDAYDSPSTGLPGPKGQALAVFNGLIGKDATLTRLPQTVPGVFAIRFENSGGPKGLILFTAGKSAAVKAQGATVAAKLVDLFGNERPLAPTPQTIGPQPVYLLDVAGISQ